MGRRTAWSWWFKIISIVLYLTNEVSSLQYTPVALNGVGDGECALLLNGPGRSSSFDYSLNLLRGGGFGYNGPHTCITYDAVNAAYLEARKRIQVAQPHGDYKPEDVATVGELLLDISVNLARTYGLSYEDIEKGLPLIDTSKTLIREICPPFLSNVECRPGKYRRFDGLCTNLENPTWGSTMQPFNRLIGPLYADGMTAPRISVTGNQLPLSRVVSRTMHPDEGFHDHAGTVMVIAWGQFIDHDYTLTATPLDPLNRNDPEECCKRPPHLKNPYCNEIIVPEDDYFYRLFNVRCLDFVRGFPAARPGCRLGSRSQFNTLTGVLDANTVYGVSEKFARKLRSGYGGQLRMNPVFREYGLKDLLPLKLDIPDEGCTRPNRSMFCFEAGEIRVNEQLVLTCMHTLMAREHNRVAEGLAQVNPHWDDETLFQEARRINIAEVQHITYNEFLPILLGKEVMEKFGLLLNKEGYWNGYDPTVNPNVIDAFAAAAYRFGHSLLPTAVERWSKAHKFIASKRLSDLIRRPYDLYRAGVFDEYFMGLMNQVAQAMDDSITQEVTNHLFKKAGARFGMDLVSFNMQRGREFGLPGYMEFRKFCGLPGADTFDELFGSMPNETIKRYSSIFEHPHDVDLWSGGVSERPLPGSMLGPTFACIIATQFSYSRRGDRFWYELPNQPSSFTPEQLKEIRKARLARVICDNTDLIDTIQLYPMVLPDHEINPRVPCRSGILPSIDFSKWADHGSQNFHRTHQPFTKINIPTNQKQNILTSKLSILLPEILHGKHPYASNFKSQPLTTIKILPPLFVQPAPKLIKNLVKIYRSKRNVENPVNNETIKEEINTTENATIASLDQVTQAITVTQISGTPPSSNDENEPSPPLNYQPFTITSSDFKNDSDAQNYQENLDFEDIIRDKIQNINPSFDNNDEINDKNNEELNTDEEKENSKDYDAEKENSNDYDTEKENLDDYEDKAENKDNQTFKNYEDESENKASLVINVPDENLNKQEYAYEDEESIKEKENTENDEEISLISDDFIKHITGMNKAEEKQDILNNNEDDIETTDENKETNLENFETENNNEKNEKSFFDDIISRQIETNKKLQSELEYPDLDSEYEKYKEISFENYLGAKQDHFSKTAEPYVINLEGYFPFEKQLQDRNYNDDGETDTIKNNYEYQDEHDVPEESKAEIEDENKNEESSDIPYEDDVDTGTNKMKIKSDQEYKDEDVPQDADAQITDENNNEESSEKKYIYLPIKKEESQIKENTVADNIMIQSNVNNKNLLEPEENIAGTLNKILEKKNAISRQHEINNPENYKMFWSLEYKTPRP